ncbi:hypothetical protein [Lactococcus formosensis]|uniref:hypothetical protein n=1 Tax=Lactococcus formosensis TaxID=1281486 RepID=UPI002434A433|nr:hypothetical protein [Lactococcus formosensis]MDG6130817.1 hypothetical protein [Lactococcus formosensis]
MIVNIIIITYIILIILSALLQIAIIGEDRKPLTAGSVITNIVLAAIFVIALYVKLYS